MKTKLHQSSFYRKVEGTFFGALISFFLGFGAMSASATAAEEVSILETRAGITEVIETDIAAKVGSDAAAKLVGEGGIVSEGELAIAQVDTLQVMAESGEAMTWKNYVDSLTSRVVSRASELAPGEAWSGFGIEDVELSEQARALFYRLAAGGEVPMEYASDYATVGYNFVTVWNEGHPDQQIELEYFDDVAGDFSTRSVVGHVQDRVKMTGRFAYVSDYLDIRVAEPDVSALLGSYGEYEFSDIVDADYGGRDWIFATTSSGWVGDSQSSKSFTIGGRVVGTADAERGLRVYYPYSNDGYGYWNGEDFEVILQRTGYLMSDGETPVFEVSLFNYASGAARPDWSVRGSGTGGNYTSMWPGVKESNAVNLMEDVSGSHYPMKLYVNPVYLDNWRVLYDGQRGLLSEVIDRVRNEVRSVLGQGVSLVGNDASLDPGSGSFSDLGTADFRNYVENTVDEGGYFHADGNGNHGGGDSSGQDDPGSPSGARSGGASIDGYSDFLDVADVTAADTGSASSPADAGPTSEAAVPKPGDPVYEPGSRSEGSPEPESPKVGDEVSKPPSGPRLRSGVASKLDGLAYDVSDKFPFSVPFNVHKAVSKLVASPEAPRFTWVFALPTGNVEYEVDLSPFSPVATVLRVMLNVVLTFSVIGLLSKVAQVLGFFNREAG